MALLGEKTPIIARRVAACGVLAAVLAGACVAFGHIRKAAAGPTPIPGAALSSDQQQIVEAEVHLMRIKKLSSYAQLALRLDKQGKWRAALPDDQWIADAEKAGDTPYAYTLPDDNSPHHPVAIVFAPRFFTDTTPTARAALMIHELGHWQAYVKTGNSTEYDGYKAEFDAHKQLGLTDKDSLTYFMMLDGVDQYVSPVEKQYGNDPEVKAYKASN